MLKLALAMRADRPAVGDSQQDVSRAYYAM